MSFYNVTITETSKQVVAIEAENREMAEVLVQKNWDNGQYTIDSKEDFYDVGFWADKEEFDLLKANKEPSITVLLIKPEEQPKAISIENDFEAMQKAVGGYIEVYPLEEDVVLICNDEGKINGMPLNRAIYDSKHQIKEIIAGDFFICNAPRGRDDFTSLSKEQIKTLSRQFKYPEQFLRLNQEIIALPIKSKNKDYER